VGEAANEGGVTDGAVVRLRVVVPDRGGAMTGPDDGRWATRAAGPQETPHDLRRPRRRPNAPPRTTSSLPSLTPRSR